MSIDLEANQTIEKSCIIEVSKWLKPTIALNTKILILKISLSGDHFPEHGSYSVISKFFLH